MLKNILHSPENIDFYFKAQRELEEKHGPKSVVVMQVGSFYEIYEIDTPNVKIGHAQAAHSILDMTLTKKNGAEELSMRNPYMVGFPCPTINEHIPKLCNAGYTVAVWDQTGNVGDGTGTNNKKSKNTKIRTWTRTWTPSTCINDMSQNENSLMVLGLGTFQSALGNKLQKAHIVILSLNTGSLTVAQVYDSDQDDQKVHTEVYRMIHTYKPAEILLSQSSSQPPLDAHLLDAHLRDYMKQFDAEHVKITVREPPKTYLKESYQNEFFQQVYQYKGPLTMIEHIGVAKYSHSIPHIITALQYAYEQDRNIIKQIQMPVFLQNTDELILNDDSIYQLNLINRQGDRGSSGASLFDIVNKTLTPMGYRLLYKRLLSPISNVDELNNRYDKIQLMKDNLQHFEPRLNGIIDIQRKFRKMVLHTIQPYEVANFHDSMLLILELLRFAQDIFQFDNNVLTDTQCLLDTLSTSFDIGSMKCCKIHDIKRSFFPPGTNESIERFEAANQQMIDELRNFANYIGQQLKSPSGVKLKSTDKEGWYFVMTKSVFKILQSTADFTWTLDDTRSVTKDNLEPQYLKDHVKIRAPFIRSMWKTYVTNCEKRDKQITIEYFNILDRVVDSYGTLITNISDIIGDIDFTYSAAKVAVTFGYGRPCIRNREPDNASYIKAKSLRHPIIEQINKREEYVPNDICIGRNNHYGDIIYGINISGKTSLLKSVGCNLVLAQAGMFVSARKFFYWPFHHLLSKMTIKDNMYRNQSTFMVECLEIKNILARANKNTLVLSDELGSSTESLSAHSLVAATLGILTEDCVRFMFATHLFELQKLPEITNNPHIRICHFKSSIQNGQFVTDRTLAPGGMSELYGLDVARLIINSPRLQQKAFAIRNHISGEQSEILSQKTSRYNRNKYMHACESCGSTQDLETHHDYEQRHADENGLIEGRFHKNSEFNLKTLCKKCHSKITIDGNRKNKSV